jgi:putative hydrolase of the HAD superfamily
MKINSKIKILALDADDTLWKNELYYRETENKFAELLQHFSPINETLDLLLETENKTISLYGYGVKGFVLSMIETALLITTNKADSAIIEKIINLGKELINKPLILFDGVKETLHEIKALGIKLVMATKGDLLDQERKLRNSSLSACFHHIEIMSNKNESDYLKLLERLGISADEFMMVGNSVKSDILPVLNIGAYAIHIPYHISWAHEVVENNAHSYKRFLEIKNIIELLPIIIENKNAFVYST